MKRIELEIIATVNKYAPEVSKKKYLKNKDYVISIYIETACDNILKDWFGMCPIETRALTDFTHKEMLKFYRTQKATFATRKLRKK